MALDFDVLKFHQSLECFNGVLHACLEGRDMATVDEVGNGVFGCFIHPPIGSGLVPEVLKQQAVGDLYSLALRICTLAGDVLRL
jgi:hypothetical protein